MQEPKKTIEELREKASKLLKAVSAMAGTDCSCLDFQMLCTGVTIQFLDFGEEISRTEFTPAEAIIWHDIANAATQISFHTLEMQSADENGIAGHLKMIMRHAAHIHEAAELPGEFTEYPWESPLRKLWDESGKNT